VISHHNKIKKQKKQKIKKTKTKKIRKQKTKKIRKQKTKKIHLHIYEVTKTIGITLSIFFCIQLIRLFLLFLE
jgi:hypothetical protein